MSAPDLAGRVAVVLGAAGGIGAAIARLLAADGAILFLGDRDEAGCQRVVTEIEENGGRAHAVACDAVHEAQIAALVDSAVTIGGGLDILANVLALTGPGAHDGAEQIISATADAWDHTHAINLRAPMLAAKHAIPHMIARSGGSIVNISSTAAILSLGSLPAYATSKAGLHALTQSIATAHGKDRIRCNTVAPGFVETPTTGTMSAAFRTLTTRHNALPYLGTPDDIGHLVAFLASDRARYLTGQLIAVDGGQTSHLPIFDSIKDGAASATAREATREGKR